MIFVEILAALILLSIAVSLGQSFIKFLGQIFFGVIEGVSYVFGKIADLIPYSEKTYLNEDGQPRKRRRRGGRGRAIIPADKNNPS